MILTIDIGNSNTVFVGYNNDKEIIYEHRVLTFKKDTKSLLRDLLKGLELEVDDVIISCVVPSIEKDVLETVKEVFGIDALSIKGHLMQNFEINIDHPETLGADLICTSVGASVKYDLPVIVADIGSASKLTLTNKGPVYEGGIIWPGLGSSLNSMIEMIPHLPIVDLEIPKSSIGKNTIDAIQSGMTYGIVAQIEGLANRIEKEIGQKCERVLTGGYAKIFRHLLEDFIYDEHLVSEGLIEIYFNNLIKKDEK